MEFIKTTALLRLNAYKIISDVIESGIRYGYRHAHKHVENPSEDAIIEQIHLSIMNELCEIINFDEDK